MWSQKQADRIKELEAKLAAAEGEVKRLTEHLVNRHGCDMGYDR
jgi:hypothetical protein